MKAVNNNLNVPQLRFSEFRGDLAWQEKKLGDKDISEFIKDRVPLEKININTYISTKNLLPDYLGVKTSTKIPLSGSFTQFKKKDILISNIRPYLKKIWQAKMNGNSSNDVIVVRAKTKVLDSFLMHTLINDIFINYVMKDVKGVKMPRGDISSIKKYSIFFPKKEEQQKIADCLTSLDEHIDAQSQKVASLKQHKKGLMQQLFPQKDANTPQLRFSEFKNAPAWQEEILEDIGKPFNGLSGKTKDDFGKGKSYIQYKQVFSNSKININNFGLVNVSDKKQNKVKYGDVLFTTSSETPDEVGYSSVLLDKVNDLYLNSFCFGFRVNSLNELTPNFSKYLFRSLGVRKKIIKLAQGSTRFNISKIAFMKMNICFPKPKEQQKIANCLTSLDELITAQSQKVASLKQHKKGLMQQLFPNNEVNL